MRFVTLLLSVFTLLTGWGQRVTIQGYAPKYVGHTVYAYAIEDYFSYKEQLITSGNVGADSTFQLIFEAPETREIVIRSENNHGYMLVQPGASYAIYLPERDRYVPYSPNGNEVEIAFLSLDSTDINYKVLGFQRWVDDFIGNNYHLKSVDPLKFVSNLDRFKSNVEKAYKEDTSIYLKAHIRFSLAGLDNIPNAAERNRYEKYDFYIRNTPVYYNSEVYMNYISDFYQKIIPRLSSKGNQAVYEGILRSSPTLVMRALGTEYTLSNVQVRELVMIKALTDAYKSEEFPKTNILTILDSLSQRAAFKQHRVIAANLSEKLMELAPGVKAPDFVLIEQGKTPRTLNDYAGKHLYIHFMDPESINSQKEYDLLLSLHEKYGQYVQFVSVYKERELSEKARQKMEDLKWEVFAISETNPIWKNYQMMAFPQYVFIDAAGYIIASPALGPTPNGQYKTIDESFFYLKKAIDESR